MCLGALAAFGDGGELRTVAALSFGEAAGVPPFVNGVEYANKIAHTGTVAAENLENRTVTYVYAADGTSTRTETAGRLGGDALYTQGMYPWTNFQDIGVTVPGLEPSAAYTVRLYTLEPWKGSHADYRTFNVLVNGETVLSGVNPFVLAGGTVIPLVLEFPAAADASGALDVLLQHIKDQPFLCALEVLEAADGAARAPSPRAVGFKEFVRVLPDTCLCAAPYEIQARDGAAGAPRTLATDVGPEGWTEWPAPDAAAPRSYRVRRAGVADAPWSDWITPARTADAFAPLRMNSRGEATTPPDGWVDEVPYRVQTDADYKYEGTTTADPVDRSGVEDPAPEIVYQSGSFERTPPHTFRSFLFPGLNPFVDYKMRVHLSENWKDAQENTRAFRLAVNREYVSTNLINVFKLAGGRFKAAVVEQTVRPRADGTLRVDVVRVVENPIVRGFEFIPAASTNTAAGSFLTVFHADASDDPAAAAQERLVDGAPLVKTALEWTAADVPAACAGGQARLVSAGKFLITETRDDYRVRMTGTGTIHVWVDGRRVAGVVSGETARSETGAAQAWTAGIHTFHIEQLPAGGAAVAGKVELLAGADAVTPLLFTPDFSPALGPWMQHRLSANFATTTYVEPLDAAGTAFRIYGSGSDTWGKNDHGTFLYQTFTEPFEMTMRVREVENGVENTRFGFEARGALSHETDDGFIFVGGFNPRSGARPASYWDADLSNGLNIGETVDGVNSYQTGNSGQFKLPVWARLRYAPAAGGRRAVSVELSQDGVTWTWGATQTVARTRSVVAGPVAVASSAPGGWVRMDISDLEVVFTQPKGTMILLR